MSATRASRAWPWAIGLVLALTVVANVAMLVAANAPGASEVEPDYYRRALDWDRTQTERARSAALGWRAEARFGAREVGGTPLRVVLLDGAARPVTGASVSVTAIHNLEPGARSDWVLREIRPGSYTADVRPGHGGRWELRLTATRGREHYSDVVHAWLEERPR
jgi:nitrogen fixation protein FixH